MEKDKKQLLEKKISEIMKVKGRQRANDIKYSVKYIKEKEGENGFNDLVKELEKNGLKIPDVDKLSSTKWISRSIPGGFLLGAIIFFEWTEKEVFEMGRRATSSFSTIKLFLKWFSSVKNTIQMAIKGWNKYFTGGKAGLVEFDKSNKECILEIKDFDIDSMVIVYYEGVFTKIVEIATGSKEVRVEEIENKNNHRYHKFRVKW
jgi:hypothetical protein